MSTPPPTLTSVTTGLTTSAARRALDRRLSDHVERLGEEHPPIELASVDFTVVDPVALSERFGHVLDYMARVELEVDRNVLELLTLLPDPPEVDRRMLLAEAPDVVDQPARGGRLLTRHSRERIARTGP